jgi:hypothetical protein
LNLGGVILLGEQFLQARANAEKEEEEEVDDQRANHQRNAFQQ